MTFSTFSVQFLNDPVQFAAKDLIHFPKPTFLCKGRILEVVRLNHKICLLACNAQANRDVVLPR